MHTVDPILKQAGLWADDGLGLVLATVVDTWGSSPCPAGSHMVINSEAGFVGSVSGGCIESSVVSESLDLLEERLFAVTEYGVSGQLSLGSGLACGGRVKIMMEPLDSVLLEGLLGPRPALRVVELDGGKWCFVRNGVVEGELTLGDDVLRAAVDTRREERARIFESKGGRFFLQPLVPAYRLIIVGAVRIAQLLAPMATQAGFEVTVIDPRPAFATDERFPNTEMVRKWPRDAIPQMEPDACCAVVTLTHDAKPDDMALGLALCSEAFYVGALGSKRTHAARVDRLRREGYSDAEIGRIRAPVGLDIGARSPAEIAVSILAEMIAVKNGKGSRG